MGFAPVVTIGSRWEAHKSETESLTTFWLKAAYLNLQSADIYRRLKFAAITLLLVNMLVRLREHILSLFLCVLVYLLNLMVQTILNTLNYGSNCKLMVSVKSMGRHVSCSCTISCFLCVPTSVFSYPNNSVKPLPVYTPIVWARSLDSFTYVLWFTSTVTLTHPAINSYCASIERNAKMILVA